MFRKKPDPTQPTLNGEIDRVLKEIQDHKPNTDPYTAACNNLEKLYKMKTAEKQTRLKADTVVTVVANLLGIGMIVGFERANVVTSKALGFVMKPRT